MEHDRNSRDKPTYMWSIIHDKGGKNIQWRKSLSPKYMVLGKLDTYI